MLNLIRRFSACRSGATAIEYALIAAGIAIVLVGVLQSVGTEVQGPFTDATTGLQKRVSP